MGLLLIVFSRSAARAQTQSVARVDPDSVVVTNFEGWGTSLCWWAKVVGGFANREDYLSLAFTKLKLNLVRYNIGGGENPGITNTLTDRARIPGFEPANGVWNWNADANQRWVLRRAVALGANRVVAFANSPPWWMTVSGSVTGSTNGASNNLQTGCENAFANYLAMVVSNLTVLDGVKFDIVTPVNEPLSSWWIYGGRQEGCHMDAEQQARVIDHLRTALDSQHLSAGLDASEDNDEQSTLNSINAYGSALTNVTLIATHTYGANNPTGIRNLSARSNKPAWVSEYGDGDGSGLTLARRIYEDLTGAEARAWVYWQFVDNAGGWGLLYNPLKSGGKTNYTINKKYYVLGQFSQFIRPGSQIIRVSDKNSLAAYDPANQKLVIVAVNDTTTNLAVTYQLGAFAALPAAVSLICRTSPSENQAGLAAIDIANQAFNTTLIPRSVTTYVLDHVAAPLTEAEGGKVATAGVFTSADADAMLQAHTRAFYREQNGCGWFMETTRGGKASFWMQAEQIEMVLDAYERTTNASQLRLFTNLFHGFIADRGAVWTHNEFNDDLMWMVIACTRGYLLTGNPEFRVAAQTNFDACFARAWSADLGGGLWWKTDNQSKNACVNGPAAIAAALLSRACQEPAYRTKATNLFLWERATLFDPATGQVFDNIRRSGQKGRRAFSYNQGTFIGAANLLGYTNDAMQAATYTMKQLCRDGLLPTYGESGDGGGFNGICVRWLVRFMNERGAQATFEPWLQKNAAAAWSVRRSPDNLSWCNWHEPTPPGLRYSWGGSSSAVILQVVRPPKN